MVGVLTRGWMNEFGAIFRRLILPVLCLLLVTRTFIITISAHSQAMNRITLAVSHSCLIDPCGKPSEVVPSFPSLLSPNHQKTQTQTPSSPSEPMSVATCVEGTCSTSQLGTLPPDGKIAEQGTADDRRQSVSSRQSTRPKKQDWSCSATPQYKDEAWIQQLAGAIQALQGSSRASSQPSTSP